MSISQIIAIVAFMLIIGLVMSKMFGSKMPKEKSHVPVDDNVGGS